MNERTLSIFDLARRFDELDHRALCESLARINPALFCDVAINTENLFAGVPTWVNPVIAHIQDNAMVSAIKTLRLTHKNLSLKDAMQVCRLGRDGYLDEGANPSADAISLGTIMAKAMGTTLHDPLVKDAEPEGWTKTPVEPETKQSKVFIVRYEDDSSIHSIYFDEGRANAVRDSVNAMTQYDMDASNRVFVSHHYVD